MNTAFFRELVFVLLFFYKFLLIFTLFGDKKKKVVSHPNIGFCFKRSKNALQKRKCRKDFGLS